MTCRENCIHYDVCYKKPDHFDDLEVNGGCSDFQDNGEIEITREFILDNGLEFELLSYYEKKRKKGLKKRRKVDKQLSRAGAANPRRKEKEERKNDTERVI